MRNTYTYPQLTTLIEDHIVVKKGVINVQRYYVPHSFVKGTDGNEIWLKFTKSEAEPFRRDNKIPNPTNKIPISYQSRIDKSYNSNYL
jgi:hypothetical protein